MFHRSRARGWPGMAGLLGGWLALCAVCPAVGPAADSAASAAAGTISFCANLSPDEESAPTYSPAAGIGHFTLRRSTLELSWEVSFRDLTSRLLSAQVHGPQRPGANAQALFPLAKQDSLVSPIRGSIVLDDGQLEYLLTGRMYVNFATEKYPDGELRAQIQRIRPGASCVIPPAQPAATPQTPAAT